MKKIKFKNKIFVSSVVTLLLIALGVANPELVSPLLTGAACEVVKCDA